MTEDIYNMISILHEILIYSENFAIFLYRDV